MTSTEAIRLYVNGIRHELDVEPRRTLADALRDDCRLTGTHLGCEHGVCGTCTVLVDDQPVRSCLMLAVQAEGSSVRTVEGLAPDHDTLHPVQQAFWDEHGLQCGYCTPGFLMLIAGYLEQHLDAEEDDLRDLVASNLCRCTGYRNILRATLAAQQAMRAQLESVAEPPT